MFWTAQLKSWPTPNEELALANRGSIVGLAVESLAVGSVGPLARRPQTSLARDFNDEPLPLPHGAPLHLRVETELGYKMVKYLRSIELIAE